MDDTFSYACCPSTSSDYIRGADGYREAIGGARTATQARDAAVELGPLARGSGATCRGVTTIGPALEQVARPRRYGRAETAAALWPATQARRAAQRAELIEALKAGALAAAHQRTVDAAAHWDAEVEEHFGVEFSQSSVWRQLQHLGWSVQTDGTCAPARRGGDPHLEREEVAGDKKIAARQGRIVVFIDESGLPSDPAAHALGPREARRRSCNTASPGSNSPDRRGELLALLLSLLPRLDQEPAGGGVPQGAAQDYRQEAADRLGSPAGAPLEAGQGVPRYSQWPHRLGVSAGHAPELNPVEYIWGYLKHHAMPNFCARDLGDLHHRASRHLRSMQRRATLVTAFWQQAELF